jgi:hypothetical protein
MDLYFTAPTPLPARTTSVYATIRAAQTAGGVNQSDPAAVRAAGVAVIPAAWELDGDLLNDPDSDPALHFAPNGFVGITFRASLRSLVSVPCYGQKQIDLSAMRYVDGVWEPGDSVY